VTLPGCGRRCGRIAWFFAEADAVESLALGAAHRVVGLGKGVEA